MFDAIVHLARMSFTHGWLKPIEPNRPAPDRDTDECTADNRANSAPAAQTAVPQQIWFGGCCGG